MVITVMIQQVICQLVDQEHILVQDQEHRRICLQLCHLSIMDHRVEWGVVDMAIIGTEFHLLLTSPI